MTTMADGIAVGRPGDVPFALVQALVDGVVTVSEELISRALLFLLERAKLVVEPAGAAGVAAMLDHELAARLRPPVVAVLSGGNIDPLLMMRVIRHGMAAAGRYLQVRLRAPDRPGSLAAAARRAGRRRGQRARGRARAHRRPAVGRRGRDRAAAGDPRAGPLPGGARPRCAPAGYPLRSEPRAPGRRGPQGCLSGSDRIVAAIEVGAMSSSGVFPCDVRPPPESSSTSCELDLYALHES